MFWDACRLWLAAMHGGWHVWVMASPSMLPGDAQVKAAIEALFTAFASPVPMVIDGCPCCIGKRRVDRLLTTPLRQLTGDMLWSYVSGVFYTVGSERDFKYLLPRILEIALGDQPDSNGPEIILGKLRLANWQAWPADQRETIEEVIYIWFEQALARDLAEAEAGWFSDETESVLCGVARAGLSLSPWIARLKQPDAGPVLVHFRTHLGGRPQNFWEGAPAGFDELSKGIAE